MTISSFDAASWDSYQRTRGSKSAVKPRIRTKLCKRAGKLKPDVILLDVSMPGTNGLNTAQLLRKQLPTLKILIISQYDPHQLLPRSLEAGAHGCIDKARIGTDLVPTLRNLFKN
jgi:two-component system nitrate/nitrite response regulator NarL